MVFIMVIESKLGNMQTSKCLFHCAQLLLNSWAIEHGSFMFLKADSCVGYACVTVVPFPLLPSSATLHGFSNPLMSFIKILLDMLPF